MKRMRTRWVALLGVVAALGIALPLALTSAAPASAASAYYWAPYGGSNFINETPHLHQLTLTSNGTPGLWETVADGTVGGDEVYLFEDTSNGLCANQPGGGYGTALIATSCVSGDSTEQFWDFDANGIGSWLINVGGTAAEDGAYNYMTAVGSPCTANEVTLSGVEYGSGNCAVWDHFS